MCKSVVFVSCSSSVLFDREIVSLSNDAGTGSIGGSSKSTSRDKTRTDGVSCVSLAIIECQFALQSICAYYH